MVRIMTVTGSTTRQQRILALDVARGIAILGTFAANVWIFTDPAGFVGYLDSIGTDPWPQRILMQLAQGKFLGLLTLMFGIGLAVQAASAQRAGRPWPGGYRVRAALLLVDGLAHYLLVAEFDILMGYALTSMIVCGLVISSRRVRLWVAGTAVAVHALAVTALVVALAGSPSNPETPELTTATWWDMVVFRVDNAVAFRAEVIFVIPMTVALFLTGAALYSAGLFDSRGAVLRRRLMVIGAIAAPLDLAVGLFGGAAGVFAARYGIAPFVALGLLAWIAHFYIDRSTTGTVGTACERIGRTALSCYILQNIVASVLCYDWGLGLAKAVDPDMRVPFTIAVYITVGAVMVVGSRWWLGRFRQGPVEWVWRASYERLTERR
ncbi:MULTISPECIES: DUF418 domain-containing protein [unclassified Rhodococcus (in: high G+C Gram-positive bacteria)]|uniref:DUF418 domain-containing protein n=1 Tax=unclassified Rhodococcus (in: high G+C Gram-positive bacteria) TaxID=192944 RepID=UPI00233F0896|nr:MULTISPECIES: DUF418 domain-containing protein [unclassified Rhodococcus (in: high G+C Gram-positive bacteria)]MDC3724423.1 DUF418 domain-containing protein [Rhodococcus sp. Rp3]WSE22577.1 DUF418 domain-containing protein [Rhodococcus sp. PD04]